MDTKPNNNLSWLLVLMIALQSCLSIYNAYEMATFNDKLKLHKMDVKVAIDSIWASQEELLHLVDLFVDSRR